HPVGIRPRYEGDWEGEWARPRVDGFRPPSSMTALVIP
ncbi:MAG: hypothetical protein RL742_1789, partial [Bacteroidota bacterium]